MNYFRPYFVLDVVYDCELADLLSEVLEKLLDSEEEKRAIIACTVRNLETIDYFINTIGNVIVNLKTQPLLNFINT